MSLRRSIYKSPAQMRLMIAPGLATAASLDAARALMRPGVTTLELDAAAEAAIVARGGLPNFKLEHGYFHTVCASVNDDVVHGIPGARVLGAGDIVSIDSGAIIDGWNGDAAFSYVIPDPTRPEVKPGLVVAIEPMVVLGSIDTFVRDDEWTVATSDGLAAAHWEHSVAVHKDGIWVLTAEDGGAAQLAPLGVTPVPIP